MANSLGTLSSALVIQRALALVFQKYPILKRFSLDLSAEGALLNQPITSRIKTVPTVGNFGDAAQDVVDVDVSVTINQFKQILHTFTPQQLASTNRDLIDEIAQPMAVSIAMYLVADVVSLFTAANYPDQVGNLPNGEAIPASKTVVTVGNSGYSTLVAQRKALVKRGCPEAFEKFCLVNSDVYEKYLLDPLCNRSAKVTENTTDPVTTGELPGVAGFKAITEYPALPSTGNMVGVSGSPDAVVLAARIPKDPREVLPNASASAPFSMDVITDPGSGFSVMVQEWIGVDLTANVRLCWMHGKAVGNPNNLQRHVTA